MLEHQDEAGTSWAQSMAILAEVLVDGGDGVRDAIRDVAQPPERPDWLPPPATMAVGIPCDEEPSRETHNLDSPGVVKASDHVRTQVTAKGGNDADAINGRYWIRTSDLMRVMHAR